MTMPPAKPADAKWKGRFFVLKYLAVLLIISIISMVALGRLEAHLGIPTNVSDGIFLLGCLPFFLYAFVMVVLHWKARYIGKHSELWGILIVFGSGVGFFNVVYFFRHILQDALETGRYKPAIEATQATDIQVQE